MGKKQLLGAALLLSNGVASANCWTECIVPNPWGGCIKEIKVCDIGNPGTAIGSLDNDIKRATIGIVDAWHKVYGEVPDHIRRILNRYPITFITTIYPDTRAWALAAWALEEIVAKSKDRAEQSEPYIRGAPDWKKELIFRAEGYIFGEDVTEITTKDWNSPAAMPYRDKYQDIMQRFLDCTAVAQTLAPDGEQCFKTFKREVHHRSDEE